MAESDAAEARARIDELERIVRELRTRVQLLETRLTPRDENPKDEAVVRQKVVYDWQK